MRRFWLAAALMTMTPGWAEAGIPTPIAPLPVRTGDQSRLTCADFKKSIVDGSWSSTHVIRTPALTLDTGAVISKAKAGGLNLIGILEKDCASRRPS